MPMKCTEKASSAVVGQLLTNEEVNKYNAMIRKVVFEKQHVFMEDYMAGVIGVTYDEFDGSEYDTETSCSRDYLSDTDSHPENSADSDSHCDDDSYDDDDSHLYDDDEDTEDDDDTHDDEDDDYEEDEFYGKSKFRIDDDDDDDGEALTVASEESLENDVGELGRLEDFAADVARFTADALKPPVSEEPGDDPDGASDEGKASKSKGTTVSFATNVVAQEIAPPRIPFEERNPVKNLLELAGGTEEELLIPTQSVTDFFIQHSEKQIEEYDKRLITALRHNDLDEIRRMHQEEGHLLQVANQYGETILHMACRRGALDVIQYMVEEGGVSIRVRDDYGRTPLHDTCWTAEPQLDLMAYLVNLEPDMLFMTDSYGFCPLEYARLQHRAVWNKFLSDHRAIISLAMWRKTTVELRTFEKLFRQPPDPSFPITAGVTVNLNFEAELVKC